MQPLGSADIVIGVDGVQLVPIPGKESCGSAAMATSTITGTSPSATVSVPPLVAPLCNAIQDPQFSKVVQSRPTGFADPRAAPSTWYDTSASPAGTRNIVEGGGHGDGSYLQWQPGTAGFSANVAVRQDNVQIPSGTSVRCSAWGGVYPLLSFRSSSTTTLSISIDGVLCAEKDVVSTAQGWNEITGTPITVRGDVHIVEVYMSVFQPNRMTFQPISLSDV